MKPVTCDWVLFDADGVLQRLADGWLEDLTAFGGDRGQDFVLDLFAAEPRAMAGREDFAVVAQQVLDRHRITADLADVLEPAHRIVVDAGMLGAVASLRSQGIRCALATNQQNVRGAHMQTLAYGDAFDAHFYSFELGAAKPERAYFEAIVTKLAAPAARMLFLDDKEANVVSAREVGLAAEVFPADGGIEALRPILARHGLVVD